MKTLLIAVLCFASSVADASELARFCQRAFETALHGSADPFIKSIPLRERLFAVQKHPELKRYLSGEIPRTELANKFLVESAFRQFLHKAVDKNEALQVHHALVPGPNGDLELNDYLRTSYVEDGRLQTSLKGNAYMDRVSEVRLVSELKRLTAEQRTFHVIRIRQLQKGEKWRRGLDTLRHTAAARLHFLPSEDGKDLSILVPTFYILQAYINALSPEGEFPLEPRLGVTSKEDVFESIEKGGRLMVVSAPDITSLVYADGFYLGEYLATIHDLYHAKIGALLPREYRKVLPLFLEVLRNNQDVLPKRRSTRRNGIRVGAVTLAEFETVIGDLDLGSPTQLNFTGSDRNELIAHDIERLFGKHLGLIVADLQRRAHVYSSRGFDTEWFIERFSRNGY